MAFDILPKGSYAVQIGLFAEFPNAQREVKRVEALGYDAAIIHSFREGQDMFKVILGPLETRAEAHLVVTASVMSLFSAPVMGPYFATKAYWSIVNTIKSAGFEAVVTRQRGAMEADLNGRWMSPCTTWKKNERKPGQTAESRIISS